MYDRYSSTFSVSGLQQYALPNVGCLPVFPPSFGPLSLTCKVTKNLIIAAPVLSSSAQQHLLRLQAISRCRGGTRGCTALSRSIAESSPYNLCSARTELEPRRPRPGIVSKRESQRAERFTNEEAGAQLGRGPIKGCGTPKPLTVTRTSMKEAFLVRSYSIQHTPLCTVLSGLQY